MGVCFCFCFCFCFCGVFVVLGEGHLYLCILFDWVFGWVRERIEGRFM